MPLISTVFLRDVQEFCLMLGFDGLVCWKVPSGDYLRTKHPSSAADLHFQGNILKYPLHTLSYKVWFGQSGLQSEVTNKASTSLCVVDFSLLATKNKLWPNLFWTLTFCWTFLFHALHGGNFSVYQQHGVWHVWVRPQIGLLLDTW